MCSRFACANIQRENLWRSMNYASKGKAENAIFLSHEKFVQLFKILFHLLSSILTTKNFWHWNEWRSFLRLNVTKMCFSWRTFNYSRARRFFQLRVFIVVLYFMALESWHCACGDFLCDCNFLCRFSNLLITCYITASVERDCYIAQEVETWTQKLRFFNEEFSAKQQQFEIRNDAVLRLYSFYWLSRLSVCVDDEIRKYI